MTTTATPIKITGLTWHQVQAIATAVELYCCDLDPARPGSRHVLAETASTITLDPAVTALDLIESVEDVRVNARGVPERRGEGLAAACALRKLTARWPEYAGVAFRD